MKRSERLDPKIAEYWRQLADAFHVNGLSLPPPAKAERENIMWVFLDILRPIGTRWFHIRKRR